MALKEKTWDGRDQIYTNRMQEYRDGTLNPFLRTEHNYDRNQASLESSLNCKDKSLTKQDPAGECDINTIVRRFALTGQLPENIRLPQYGDFKTTTYHEALNAVAQANEAFDAMPAHVRARFHNDPEEFVDFCNDKNNLDEARKLGLVPPKELEVIKAAEMTSKAPTELEKGDPKKGTT